MKLVYTRWNDVRKFLRSIDEPLGEFTIVISPRVLASRRVYDVEIPKEFIDGSLEEKIEDPFFKPLGKEDSRIE